MAERAVDEAMLIRESRTTVNETSPTARKGTWYFVSTFAKNSE